MDVIQIGTLIGSLLGSVSFVLYYRVKKDKIKAETESDNLKNLRIIVIELKSEREGLIDRVNRLETNMRHLNTLVGNQDEELNIYKMSLNSAILCDKKEKCPILMKRRELIKTKETI
jgi:hypothetical protein